MPYGPILIPTVIGDLLLPFTPIAFSVMTAARIKRVQAPSATWAVSPAVTSALSPAVTWNG